MNDRALVDLGTLRDKFVNSRYYQIERRVFDAVSARQPLQEFETELEDFTVESYDDYFHRFNALLWYEEVDRMMRMLSARFENRFENGPNEIGIRFARYPEYILDPSSIKGAQVVVEDPELRIVADQQQEPADHLVFEVIRTVADPRSDRPLRLSPIPMYSNYTAEQLDDVQFERAYLIPPFEQYDRCRDAMHTIRDDYGHRLRQVLVAAWSENHDLVLRDYDDNTPLIDFDATNDWDLQRLLDRLDQNQQKAIKDILLAKFRPYPYVIVGTPGSGKTRTVIEAIYQVFRRSKGSKRILICASSESYLKRLYDSIIWYGYIRESDMDDSRVRKLRSGSSGNSERFIHLATTFTSAEFEDKYFDYIFLDEASGAHQPETLIPWCKLKDDGCFVMSGDPNLLGTRPRNRSANKHGLRLSMMGTFLNKEVPEDRRPRDPRYITSLVQSYRCDPRILRWANRVQYQRRIVLKDYTTFDNLLLGLRITYPVVTVDVRNIRGRSVLEDTCIEYINRLYECNIKPKRIGVVAMTDTIVLRDRLRYAVHRLSQETRIREFIECKIDTAIEFLGVQVHAIIIVLDSFRRRDNTEGAYIYGGTRQLNLAMSRAKWVVFIIGDFTELDHFEPWADITEHTCNITL